jgi:rSAM/selenodomain-associated transferase 1
VRRTPVAFAVFARAPRPGRVKSRLIPTLGAWRAARLHARLVEHALRAARAARCGPLELHCAPHARDRFLLRCAARFGASLHAQRGRDLGERMARAFQGGLRRHRALILVGSDCPALGARELRRAARALIGGADAVISPAADGGYALIGLRRADARLFRGMVWGADDVYRRTSRVLDRLGWRWRALATVWDVDRPEDYERLRESGLLLKRGRSS